MSQQKFICQCGKPRAKHWHLVCEDCWKQLPADLQSEVFYTYKHDQGGPRHRAACRRVFEFLKAAPTGVAIVDEAHPGNPHALEFVRKLGSNRKEVA